MKLNWSTFESKHENPQMAFQSMCYMLFCTEFDQPLGIFAYKNQIAIETEPISQGDRVIGFQSKYLEQSTKINACKNSLIKAIQDAKRCYPKINTLYFYINKTFSQSKTRNQNKPKYQIELEQIAKKNGIELIWRVESHLESQLGNSRNKHLHLEYFPKVYFEQSAIDRLEQIDIARTALIQLKIEKIRSRVSVKSWIKTEKELNKLYLFVDYSNSEIAKKVIFLLSKVGNYARFKIPEETASNIADLVTVYIPTEFKDEKESNDYISTMQSLYIGYSLAYDAFIHLNNYRIAMHGLHIWKFIYRHAKRNNNKKIVQEVYDNYRDLENTLKRPEREDLAEARQLVKIFKDDLEDSSMAFPILPNDLMNTIYMQEKKYKIGL